MRDFIRGFSGSFKALVDVYESNYYNIGSILGIVAFVVVSNAICEFVFSFFVGLFR